MWPRERAPPRVTGSAVLAVVTTFALRLVNPTDGPLGEEPGWRGFAQPGLQGPGYSPLRSTAILAVLVAGWHVPLFFLEDGGLQVSVVVNGLVATVAVTFWCAWLFNRCGGSVLMVLIAHSMEGSIQSEGWIYTAVWSAVAIGLVLADRPAWRRSPAAATDPVPSSSREEGSLMVRRFPLVAFFVLAYALTGGSTPCCWFNPLIGLLGLFGPALAAIIVTAVTDGRPGVRALLGRLVCWRVPYPVVCGRNRPARRAVTAGRQPVGVVRPRGSARRPV